jgi:hypothetical protein
MGKTDNVVGYLADFPSDLFAGSQVQLNSLPALPSRMLSTVALGWRAALSCASKLEQASAAITIPSRSE